MTGRETLAGLLVAAGLAAGVAWLYGEHPGPFESPDVGIGLQEEIAEARAAVDPGTAAWQLRSRLATFRTVEECGHRTGLAWVNCPVPSRALIAQARAALEELDARVAGLHTAANHNVLKE